MRPADDCYWLNIASYVDKLVEEARLDENAWQDYPEAKSFNMGLCKIDSSCSYCSCERSRTPQY